MPVPTSATLSELDQEHPPLARCKAASASEVKVLRWKLDAVAAEAEANRLAAAAAAAREAAAYAMIEALQRQLDAARRQSAASTREATKSASHPGGVVKYRAKIYVHAHAPGLQEEEEVEFEEEEEEEEQPRPLQSAPCAFKRQRSAFLQEDGPQSSRQLAEARPAVLEMCNEPVSTPWAGGVFTVMSFRGVRTTASNAMAACNAAADIVTTADGANAYGPVDLDPMAAHGVAANGAVEGAVAVANGSAKSAAAMETGGSASRAVLCRTPTPPLSLPCLPASVASASLLSTAGSPPSRGVVEECDGASSLDGYGDVGNVGARESNKAPAGEAHAWASPAMSSAALHA